MREIRICLRLVHIYPNHGAGENQRNHDRSHRAKRFRNFNEAEHLWSHYQRNDTADNRCRNIIALKRFDDLSNHKARKQERKQNDQIVKNTLNCHIKKPSNCQLYIASIHDSRLLNFSFIPHPCHPDRTLQRAPAEKAYLRGWDGRPKCYSCSA